MSSWDLAWGSAIVLVGSLVQGSVGFGLGLIGVPVLALLDERLLPATILLLAVPLTLAAAVREHEHLDLSGTGWMILFRLPGTALAIGVLALVPRDALGVLFGLAVLAAVAVSAPRAELEPTLRSQAVAGVASGLMSTAAGIGGPPVAIIYQRRPGGEVRSTLSSVFLVGSIISLVALAVSGHLGRRQVLAAAELFPAMAVGFALSGPLRRVLDRRWLRPAVLGVAGASAVAVIGQTVAG